MTPNAVKRRLDGEAFRVKAALALPTREERQAAVLKAFAKHAQTTAEAFWDHTITGPQSIPHLDSQRFGEHAMAVCNADLQALHAYSWQIGIYDERFGDDCARTVALAFNERLGSLIKYGPAAGSA